jgi:HEAT repeat protein
MPSEELAWKVIEARRSGDVETLVAALQDETEASIAADSLGDLGAISAIPAILPLLDATNPNQRASAVIALGKLDASVACERVMEIAQDDEVAWVRAWAIEALARMSCDSESLLVHALQDPDIRVRRVTAEALMKAGKTDAIPALQAARKREYWFSRGTYRKAIRRIKRRARRTT